ncbi:Zn-finger domain-containing protein, partial [Mycena amicta]
THRCPYCKRPVLTFSAITRHIAHTPACSRVHLTKVAERRARTPPIVTIPPVPEHGRSPMPVGLENPDMFADDFVPPLREETPPPPQPIPSSQRARVESVVDQDDPENLKRYPQPFIDEKTGKPGKARTPLRVEKTPFEKLREQQAKAGACKFSPFDDKDEWELCDWLLRRVNQTGTDEFLKLESTRKRKLSFHNNRAFLKKVNALPTGPDWTCHVVTVTGDRVENGERMKEEAELWTRDPLDCIKEIMSNPAFKDHMLYAPERVYSTSPASEDDRIIDEMWTADEWYELQVRCHSSSYDACVCPVIIASDKTKLTNFGGDKAAYPVYLTIRNLSKEIRRQPKKYGTVLLGYLPTAKLSCFSSDDAQSLAMYRLFHYSMSLLLEPLVAAGADGVEMVCADGFVRQVFPILCAYVADHPEQCLVACCKQNRCPRCLVDPTRRGENVSDAETVWRDQETTLHLLRDHKNRKNSPLFDKHGLNAVYQPFWAKLPYSDIFTCISPDLLHQLHKGVFKDHLVSWCIAIVGKDEFDERFKAMNVFAGLRQFKKGISGVSQWTGKEHKEMQRVFMGVMTGAVNDKVLTVVRALIDFIYYAQLQSHTKRTIDALQASLDTFHSHKQVIIDYNIRKHFNVPKIHSMQHYVEAIWRLGSLDGFNTESPEHLHIDFAKNGYKACNGKDYTEQMAIWLQRREAIALRARYIEWLDSQDPSASQQPPSATYDDDDDHPLLTVSEPTQLVSLPSTSSPAVAYTIAKSPAAAHRTVAQLRENYHAVEFTAALTIFLRNHFHSPIQPGPFDYYDVFHQVKIHLPLNRYLDPKQRATRVRALPLVPKVGRKPESPAIFDTALVVADPKTYSRTSGIAGLIPVRIRVIFRLPPHLGTYPHPLAFIEWFTPLTQPDPISGLYTTRRSTRNHLPNTAVISVERIVRSCHLVGQSRRKLDRSWSAFNVLDKATVFLVNPYIHVDTF